MPLLPPHRRSIARRCCSAAPISCDGRHPMTKRLIQPNRRDFLALSAGAGILAFGAPAWAATAEAPKRLIVVMLRGAVDGLNVVLPYGDEAYYAARPTIAVAKPGSEDG